MITKIQKNLRNRNFAGNRFALLASLGETVFHSGDIANLWRIRDKNTLHTTLSRYQAAGLLYRVHKGLYAIKPLGEIDPQLLGLKALHGPAYVSCESVLFEQGILNQSPREITLVSAVSKRFVIAGHRFRSRKLHEKFLHHDIGIEQKNGIRKATVERAAADMLYFYPKKYFDAQNFGLLDLRKVRDIAEAVGYKIALPKNI